MAGDTEDLVLSISADVRQMQRALQRITADTSKAAATLAKQFNDAGDKSAGAFDRIAANSNSAANRVANDARRMTSAMNSSRLQTANLAAQLNDIGVQLASGTSPLTIAIQQGSQINQVLGAQGARGAVTLLGGAFASLINPVSLATIAIISLGGYAVQYFTQLLSDGEKSAETLKREAELIQQVARQWGEAMPALKAYADERQKLADQASIREATGLAVNEQFAGVRETLQGLKVDLSDVVDQMQQAGASETQIAAVQRAFSELERAVSENKATAADAKAVQAELMTLFINTGIPATGDLAAQFYVLAEAIAAASGAAQKFTFEGNIGNSVLPNLGTVGPVYSSGGQFINEQQLQTVRANATRSQAQIEAERAARAGGGRASSASEAEREAAAVAKLIEELERELSLINATDEQRAVATALRRAGSAATDEQKAKIEQLVLAIEVEKEALKENEEAMRSLQEIGKTALNGLATALSDGKLEAKELLSILIQVAQQLLSMKGFGGGGDFLSNIFSAIRSIFPFAEGGIAAHGRPHGPPLKRYARGGVSNSAAIFGEAGPEAAVPLPDGRRIPVDLRMPRVDKAPLGSREQIDIRLTDDSGRMAEIADQRIQTRGGAIVRVAVEQSQKATRKNFSGMLAESQMREF